ncbi:hypothetical protein [Streptomyces justiciae]|uniref:hypothetical protein n=1 Tax=Streptomyces justiciae TaxID=2780140 RepID=UPI0018809BE5|nr:hypothetical protein [Streptomyces justiciae]MBE8470681.1 hypothetical protein [Streptomyces justiciae]
MLVAGAAVAAVVLMAAGGDDSPDDKPGSSASSSPSPTLSLPSELPSKLPSEVPTKLPSQFPTELPSEFPSGLESLIPSLAADEVPYYTLQAGDCFDTDAARPGQAAKRSCREPHDAEVVKVAELEGDYATDSALKKAASALCERTLDSKAESQPEDTVRGTLVQYPDTTGYRVGIDDVACSLAADTGAGSRKLTQPLT